MQYLVLFLWNTRGEDSTQKVGESSLKNSQAVLEASPPHAAKFAWCLPTSLSYKSAKNTTHRAETEAQSWE